MFETVRYYNDDFEQIFNRILNLEEKVNYWSVKTNKNLIIETRFSYNVEDDTWEGELEVRDAKKNK